MLKARVVVTEDCNHRIITDIKELKNYSEVMITGGEPMLIPEKVLEFTRQLNKMGYGRDLYLYTAPLLRVYIKKHQWTTLHTT